MRSSIDQMEARSSSRLPKGNQGRAMKQACKRSHLNASFVTATYGTRLSNQGEAYNSCKTDEEEEETQLGSLRIHSSITMKKTNKSKGLTFADVEIGGKHISALIDMGASNLFVSEGGTQVLELCVKETKGHLKTPNSEEVLNFGVARDMNIPLGLWHGKEIIEVISFDDCDFIIGMDFLDRIDAMIVSSTNCICIIDTKSQCIMPIKRSIGKGPKRLLAMQLTKETQEYEVTYHYIAS